MRPVADIQRGYSLAHQADIEPSVMTIHQFSTSLIDRQVPLTCVVSEQVFRWPVSRPQHMQA